MWITSLSVAHPQHWVSQEDAARRIGEATGEKRRVNAIAKGTRIRGRALAIPPDLIGQLGSIEERNRIYQDIAPQIAAQAARGALARSPAKPVGFLTTSSCTGYMIPGLDVVLAQVLKLAVTTARLPITEAGCAGGVVAIARLADFLRVHPEVSGLAVAAEVCSLAFHSQRDPGNLTSALIFGDGAGAALMESSNDAGLGLEVIDSLSLLVPDSQDALGFDLTDAGFYPVLTRDLADLLRAPMVEAVTQLLSRHELTCDDVTYWLLHPGGRKILESAQETFGLCEHDLRWSWQSMQDFGNASSAAIFDVLHRYMADSDAPCGWGVVIAFGPGVSLELLLVRR